MDSIMAKAVLESIAIMQAEGYNDPFGGRNERAWETFTDAAFTYPGYMVLTTRHGEPGSLVIAKDHSAAFWVDGADGHCTAPIIISRPSELADLIQCGI